MATESLQYFIYGMSVMFYSMMVWLFWRKGKETLLRLIMWIMLLQDLECFKDLFSFAFDAKWHLGWHVITCADMFIIPFYVLVLMELCKPGWFSFRKLFIHELPFVLLPVLYFCTGNVVWYNCLVAWGGIYGTATLVLTFFFITQYHRQLKLRFSYQDNINLNWLRGILISFWVILLVWTTSCFEENLLTDNIYMFCSLFLWVLVSYFCYKHESVIDELREDDACDETADAAMASKDYAMSEELKEALNQAFMHEKLYLNPKLKLSDIAKRVGTNRTYISRYFNKDNGQTFYDYVNALRIRHAEHLLVATSLPVYAIAEQSGFTSISTFRRAFADYHDCSPTEFRKISRCS